MGDILNAADHKIATIGQDGIVYGLDNHVKLGYVADDGYVFNAKRLKVGHYEGNGYIFEGERHIATIRDNGKVYDMNDHYLGKVKGDHIESGGAALALLVR